MAIATIAIAYNCVSMNKNTSKINPEDLTYDTILEYWFKTQPSIECKIITKTMLETYIYSISGMKISIHNLELFHNAFTHKSFMRRYNNIDHFIENQCNLESQSKIEYFQSQFEKKNIMDYVHLFEKPDYMRKLLNFRIYNDYERLEFFGDSAIYYIFKKYIFEKYKDGEPKLLNDKYTGLSKTEGLASINRKIELNQFFLISKDQEDKKMRNIDKKMEDQFEAFIGAFEQDQGIESTRIFLYNLLDKYVDLEEICDENYKGKLGQIFKKNKWELEFLLLDKDKYIENEVSKFNYTIGVKYIPEMNIPFKFHFIKTPKLQKIKYIEKASGSTKKEAESKVSKMILEKMKKYNYC